MYAYVFDSFVQDQKFRSEASRIETRLSTLGIQGRSEKITILKNIQDSVRSLLKRGADTLVVVGNDQTVVKVLPIIIEADATLGIIPVGPSQQIATALGLPGGAGACDMLSRRIIRRIDVGTVGNATFLVRVDLPAGARIQCDGNYTVEGLEPDVTMSIVNLGSARSGGLPDDGRIELVVTGRTGGWFGRAGGEPSVFSLTKAKIERTGGDARMILDGQVTMNPPATIGVLRKKLHIIVGRDRAFE